MIKNIIVAVVIALFVNVIGLNLYNNHIEEQLSANTKSVSYVAGELGDIRLDITSLESKTMEAVSSNELRNAYISIEDNKRFMEYEVKMSRKSIQEFIVKLNEDMERLNSISNLSQENDIQLEDKLNFVLNELDKIQNTLRVKEETLKL
jgi:hypothetical protein